MRKENSDGTYDGLKEELKQAYGVFIGEEAIYAAKFYIQTRNLFDYHETMEEKMRRVLSEACDLTLSKVLKRLDEEDFDRLIYVLHRGFVERNEIVKEKNEESKNWLLGVEEELDEAKWMFVNRFVYDWQMNYDFPKLVKKVDATSHLLYLALENVGISQISNLLSEFVELIHKFLQLIGKKYYNVMAVGNLAVQEVVSHLTGTPIEFEHELSTTIENGLRTLEEEKELPPSKTLGRLLVRNIARSINERGMVVYPTDAALNLPLMNDGIHDKDDYKKWLEENMVPMLSKIDASCKVEDEIYTVYVDTFVGSSELSFRLEKESTKNIVEDWFSKKHVGPLKKLRAIYSLEREVIDVTLKLKGICSGLMSNLRDETLTRANSGEITVGISVLKDFLLSYQKTLSLMQQGPELEKKASIQAGKLINNRQTKEVKNGVHCLVRRLKDRLRVKNGAIHVITLSVMRSIRSSSNPPNKPAGVYLFSGLDNAAKMDLLDDVAEQLTVSEGIPQLIHVDLSDKFWSQSLLFSSTPKSFCRNSKEPAFSVVEGVRRWPYCVIVFDNIEKADASVYSTIIRILDTGILHCVDGSMFDFRNTTIVFMTDVGRKDLNLGLFGFSHQYYSGCSENGIQQDGPRFRTELLRRLDDILWAKSNSRQRMKFLRFSKIKAWSCFFLDRGTKEIKT